MNAKLLSAETVRDQVKFFLNRKDLTLLERRNAELALGHLNEVVRGATANTDTEGSL